MEPNHTKPSTPWRTKWCYRVKVTCQDDKERWMSSVPMSWTEARAEAVRYQRDGFDVRLAEVQE